MRVIRKNAKFCSESRITLCLDAGWAEKGCVVMVDVRLNMGQQCMVTTNETDCSELSWKEHGQQIKRSYCLPPWDAGQLSCGVCYVHLWPALSSRQF